MMELTINNVVYQFNFGIGFLREINKTQKVTREGITKELGGAMKFGDIIDGDVLALVDVLDTANKGQNPRLTRQVIEAYLEDENTDIDAVFDQVIDFLKKSNATKKLYKRVVEEVEKQENKEKK